MTAHRDPSNIIHAVKVNERKVEGTKSADFAASRQAHLENEPEDEEEEINDNAMSVDGDVSYCSVEMDELGDRSF